MVLSEEWVLLERVLVGSGWCGVQRWQVDKHLGPMEVLGDTRLGTDETAVVDCVVRSGVLVRAMIKTNIWTSTSLLKGDLVWIMDVVTDFLHDLYLISSTSVD